MLFRGEAFSEYRRATWAVVAAMALGLVALAVFALQAETPTAFLSVVGGGLAVLGAGFALGAVTGFLFGIPHQLQQPASSTTDDDSDGVDMPYVGNSSLEQISDWLTKIIVGVGLTQLTNVPSALGSLGEALGPALGGFAGSATFGVFAFLYFAVGGFFVTYLWTRLPFIYLLVLAEKEARNAARREIEIGALELEGARAAATPNAAGDQAPAGQEQRAGTIQTEALREPPGPIEVLWVDDRPDNNAREMAQLEARGIRVTTKTRSEDALAELRASPDKYAAVITDLKREGDRDAGYKFIDAGRGANPQIPFLVYTASSNPMIDSVARQHGAFAATNSPIQLIDLLNRAITKSKAR